MYGAVNMQKAARRSSVAMSAAIGSNGAPLGKAAVNGGWKKKSEADFTITHAAAPKVEYTWGYPRNTIPMMMAATADEFVPDM